MRTFFLLLTSCLLVSCGGGIIGTGTGNGNIVSNLPETAGNQSPTSDSLVDVITIAHENQTVGTPSDLPHINIINASNIAVSITNDADGTPLFQSPIAPDTFSDTAIVSLNENNLNILDSRTDQTLIAIRPLTAVAGSLSTIFIINNTSAGISTSILNTQSFNPSTTTALIRIIQDGTLTSENQNATLSLIPEGDNPGSSAVEFENVSVTTSESNYQVIGAGDYVLVDPLNRIPRSALSIQNGRVYTLIVQAGEGGDLLIHEDSRFEF